MGLPAAVEVRLATMFARENPRTLFMVLSSLVLSAAFSLSLQQSLIAPLIGPLIPEGVGLFVGAFLALVSAVVGGLALYVIMMCIKAIRLRAKKTLSLLVLAALVLVVAGLLGGAGLIGLYEGTLEPASAAEAICDAQNNPQAQPCAHSQTRSGITGPGWIKLMAGAALGAVSIGLFVSAAHSVEHSGRSVVHV